MNKSKPDTRSHIAFKMTADLFLKYISRISGLANLPKLNEVDERLKQRTLQAIKSESL